MISLHAIKLIQQFDSIDGLYANLDEVTPVRIKTLLEENEDSARQSLDLTTIVNDVPIVLDEESCRFWTYDRENVLDFLKEMEFSSIVSRVPVVDSPMRPQNLEAHQGTLITDSIVEVKGDYQTVQNITDLESLISDIKEVNRFAFDVETTSLDAMKASVVGISFSPKPSRFLTIFDINFSIASLSIGLFLKDILIDFATLSLSKGTLRPLFLTTVNSLNWTLSKVVKRSFL